MRDGLEVDTWEPGILPNNRPATRASFLRALREEILPTVRDGGTLYLFVGDHGELTEGDDGESAITMWQLKRGTRRRSAWITDEKEILTVSELRRVLAEGIGRGRVVFCMTQCHSGGFHYLGIPREMVAPRSWFATPPEWARGQRASAASLPIAGFTATDEESVAAGCVSDPDHEGWVGYERFAPESLLGTDLLSGREISAPRLSLAATHEAATLVDATIDKPRSTSEQYLERWSGLIEEKLARELRLTGRARNAVTAYQRSVDTGRVGDARGEFAAKRAQFRRYTEKLVAQNAALRGLLLEGTQRQLAAAVEGRGEGGRGRFRGNTNRRSQMADARRVWSETLRPEWQAALHGSNPPVTGSTREFERHLLEREEDGRNFLMPRGGDNALLNEAYWFSTYGDLQRFDAAKADAVTHWAAERRERILAWAEGSRNAGVRAGARKIATALEARSTPATDASAAAASPIDRRTAAERVLFYRRVLAAWEFLLAMDAKPELARLHELIEIERTPLPATDVASASAPRR